MASKKARKQAKLSSHFAQYYRVNGASTQNKGVIPDISFPLQFNALDYREAKQKGALAWDSLNLLPCSLPVHVSHLYSSTRAALRQSLQEDLKSKPWQRFIEKAKKNKNYEATLSQLSLHLSRRRSESQNLSTKQDSASAPLDSLKKDNYLRQSLFLLADMIDLQQEAKPLGAQK